MEQSRSRSPVIMTPWHISLFGGLRLKRDDRSIERFATYKTGALLAYLSYYLDKPHPRETLTTLLWPDADPSAGRHSLSMALSSLRKLLEPPDTPAASVLITDRFQVQLHPDYIRTDVRTWETTLANASRGTNTWTLNYLLEAVNGFSAPLLPDY